MDVDLSKLFAGRDVQSAAAVEVAAMLDDAVIAVKHVSQPGGGKITVTTRVLFALASLLLVLAAVCFANGLVTASENHRAYKQWTDVDNKSEFDFRPTRIAVYNDAVSFGGTALGLFCFVLAMLRARNETVQPYFRIGRDQDVDFPTNDAPGESFPLVAPCSDKGFVLNISQEMTGEIVVEGKATGLDKLVALGLTKPSQLVPGAIEVPIPNLGRFQLRLEGQAFLVSSVSEPQKQAVPFFASVDRSAMTYFFGALVLSAGMLALLMTTPPNPKSLAMDGLPDGKLIPTIDMDAWENPIEEPPEDTGKTSGGGGVAGEKQAFEEGVMGRRESERDAGHYSIKNRSLPPQLSKERAQDAARQAGFLGIISSSRGGAFTSLVAVGDLSSNVDPLDEPGGLRGTEIAEMAGGFGNGLVAMGPGGGGSGWDTVGTSDCVGFNCDRQIGRIALRGGNPTGFGIGGPSQGGLDKPRRPRGPAETHKIKAVYTPGLDKSIIRRYIRTKLPMIRNCYEKQLQVNQGLRGTVVSRFQISPNGTVQGASASGLGDSTVENCVGRVIATIQFPKPEGGTYVRVKYPFNMSSR